MGNQISKYYYGKTTYIKSLIDGYGQQTKIIILKNKNDLKDQLLFDFRSKQSIKDNQKIISWLQKSVNTIKSSSLAFYKPSKENNELIRISDESIQTQIIHQNNQYYIVNLIENPINDIKVHIECDDNLFNGEKSTIFSFSSKKSLTDLKDKIQIDNYLKIYYIYGVQWNNQQNWINLENSQGQKKFNDIEDIIKDKNVFQKISDNNISNEIHLKFKIFTEPIYFTLKLRFFSQSQGQIEQTLKISKSYLHQNQNKELTELIEDYKLYKVPVLFSAFSPDKKQLVFSSKSKIKDIIDQVGGILEKKQIILDLYPDFKLKDIHSQKNQSNKKIKKIVNVILNKSSLLNNFKNNQTFYLQQDIIGTTNKWYDLYKQMNEKTTLVQIHSENYQNIKSQNQSQKESQYDHLIKIPAYTMFFIEQITTKSFDNEQKKFQSKHIILKQQQPPSIWKNHILFIDDKHDANNKAAIAIVNNQIEKGQPLQLSLFTSNNQVESWMKKYIRLTNDYGINKKIKIIQNMVRFQPQENQQNVISQYLQQTKDSQPNKLSSRFQPINQKIDESNNKYERRDKNPAHVQFLKRYSQADKSIQKIEKKTLKSDAGIQFLKLAIEKFKIKPQDILIFCRAIDEAKQNIKNEKKIELEQVQITDDPLEVQIFWRKILDKQDKN